MTEELVKSESALERFPTDLEAFQEAAAANIGAGTLTAFDLPRIKVPTGGLTQWQVPTDSGDAALSTIEGVILLACDTRVYWATAADAPGATGNNPPDCSSADGLIGIGHPGGRCFDKDPEKVCPFAKFHSDPKGGPGQACKAVKQIFFLREGNMVPDLIALPPTSHKAAKGYLVGLTFHGTPHYGLVTSISLEKQKSAAGKPYAIAKFKAGRRLTPDEFRQMSGFRDLMVSMVKTLAVDAETVETAKQEG